MLCLETIHPPSIGKHFGVEPWKASILDKSEKKHHFKWAFRALTSRILAVFFISHRAANYERFKRILNESSGTVL